MEPVDSRFGRYGSECPHCREEVEPVEFPYAAGVTCVSCGRVSETDWEGSRDGMEWWFTGVTRW